MDCGMSDFSPEEQPTGERWDPLGAPNDECDMQSDNSNYFCKHSNQ